MPRTYTRLEIRDRIRARTDRVNSDFWTDAQLNEEIEASNAEFYDLLVEAYGEDYFTINTTFTTVAQQENYDIVTDVGISDMYKLRVVEIRESDEDFSTLKPFNIQEMNRFRNRNANYATLWGDTFIRYRLIGNNIYLLPAPKGGETIRIWYVPSNTKFVDDTSTVDGVNGWEEYIVADVGIKAYQKEELDPSIFFAQKERIENRIRKMARTRDAANPPRIVSTKRRNLRWTAL